MIPSLVVDTDVLSFLFKKDSRAELYRARLDGSLTVISFMTLAETDRWALARGWGEARKTRMKEFLSDFIVVHSDRALCLRWAEAIDSARRNGRPDSNRRCLDRSHRIAAWRAACYTHNYSNYTGVDGLAVISESAP